MDNQSYYDAFSGWYERGRDRGYHAFLDRAQTNLISKYAQDKDVCEIGCGTGLILKNIAPIARSAVGIDISNGMLQRARDRDLKIALASACELPFDSNAFDLVYSFKVLPHIEDIEGAIREVERVLRPGGRTFLEFYNVKSIRHFIKKLKPAHKVSEGTTDEDVFTRYDSIEDATRYLPEGLELVDIHGIRIITPSAQFHQIPFVSQMTQWVERRLQQNAQAKKLGGFLILEVKKAE